MIPSGDGWATAFWASLALVAYAYAGYPLLVAMLARTRGTAPRATDAPWPELTVVIAARDEGPRIAERVADVLAQDYPPDRLRVCVASDGSGDDTASRAAASGDPRVQVLALVPGRGKAAALDAAVARCATPLLAFTDARQRYAPGALRALVAPFADPGVGAVSGELRIDGGGGLYWRIETRLRADEARLGWLHGVSGAHHAMRRALYVPMPPGTLLDDMWLPLHVRFTGARVWMARDAVAHDRASRDGREEFARKRRTLAGNWQLLARCPRLLHPVRNPVFFAWVSHKLLRLLAPWALLLALLAAAVARDPGYRVALAAQLAAYALALLALLAPRQATRLPLASAAGAFLLLNLAALVALPTALFADHARLWRRH